MFKVCTRGWEWAEGCMRTQKVVDSNPACKVPGHMVEGSQIEHKELQREAESPMDREECTQNAMGLREWVSRVQLVKEDKVECLI